MATIDLNQTDTTATAQVGCSGATIGGTPLADRCSDGGTLGSTEVIPDVGGFGVTNRVCWNDISDAINETVWASGNLTWRLNVTTSLAEVTLQDVYICRFNSSDVSQETLGSVIGLGTTLGTTGVRSGTISISAATSPAATDRLALIYVFDRPAGNMGAGSAFGVTPNQVINTPIERSYRSLMLGFHF